MNDTHVTNRDLIILESIEQNPDATQASLAAHLGVAVGTVNWHIKRLVAKGYVKVRRVERRKLRYLITADGLALQARLTVNYIQSQFQLYRLVRSRMTTVLEEAQALGYNAVRLLGDGDVAEVCRLSCLEQGVAIVDDPAVPLIKIENLKMFLIAEDNHKE